jgi:hypothetical protein
LGGIVTNAELFKYLEDIAKKYRLEALESLARNCHMNELTAKDIKKLEKHRKLAQRALDAVLVDFINRIAQPGDLGLYVKHLFENPTVKNITSEVHDAVRKYMRSKKGKKIEIALKRTHEAQNKLKETRKVSEASLNQKMTK